MTRGLDSKCWTAETLHFPLSSLQQAISVQRLLFFVQLEVSEEKYVPCSLQVRYGEADQRQYDGIGCRYKGGIGSIYRW